MEKYLVYKVSFDTDKSSAHFFINGIDEILKSEYFNTPFKDVKTNKEYTLKESILEQLSKPPKQQQQTIEFSRYKQDCRKRAFEMAHQEKEAVIHLTKGEKGDAIDVEAIADKYYNWLISIPNE